MMILALAATTVATSANAAEPVSLGCVLETRNGPRAFELSLNENEGTASYRWADTGLVVKQAAVFTPASVAFGTMSVDRVSLSLEAENYAPMVQRGELPPTAHGKCEIKKLERSF